MSPGLPDSKYEVFDDRKVLMVAKGGTLEIHGKKKTSWTRLAQSIPATNDLACTFIYNHSDVEVLANRLHVLVCNLIVVFFFFNVHLVPRRCMCI